VEDISMQVWVEESSSRMGLQVSPKSAYIVARLWGVQIPKHDNFHNYCHEKWGQDNVVGIVTLYRLDG
jgi:hypothetical protein